MRIEGFFHEKHLSWAGVLHGTEQIMLWSLGGAWGRRIGGSNTGEAKHLTSPGWAGPCAPVLGSGKFLEQTMALSGLGRSSGWDISILIGNSERDFLHDNSEWLVMLWHRIWGRWLVVPAGFWHGWLILLVLVRRMPFRKVQWSWRTIDSCYGTIINQVKCVFSRIIHAWGSINHQPLAMEAFRTIYRWSAFKYWD